MDQNPIKIADIITAKYADFLSYCASSGKIFTSDLTNIDYVAFRTSSGQSREYIKEIRSMIENPVAIISNSSKNSSVVDSQAETKTETEQVISASLDVAEELESPKQTFEDDVKPIKNAAPAVIVDRKSNIAVKKGKKIFSGAVKYAKKSSAKKAANTKTKAMHKRATKTDMPSDSRFPLSYLFGVEASDFSEINIDRLNLSVRASNCLRKAKYTTLEDVLKKNAAELQNLQNMGLKSVNEVIRKVKDFVCTLVNIDHFSPNKSNPASSSCKSVDEPIDGELKVAVEALLIDDEYNTDRLTDSQLKRFDSFRTAVSDIGEEICLESYLNPQYSRQICNMLLKFSTPYIQYRKMIENAIHRISLLNDSMKTRKALPFIKIYEARMGEKLPCLLSKCKEDTSISKIPFLYEPFQKEEDMLALIIETNKFFSWLDFDVNELIASISNNIRDILSKRNKRSLEVFSLRAGGKTLEEIGNLYGVTRERVRQMELKMYKTFWFVYSRQKYDLIMLVYALRDGDTTLYFEELKELLGDFADTLWACIKHFPQQKHYYYSRPFDAIVIWSNESPDKYDAALLSKIRKALATLPELIEKEKKDSILSSLSSKRNLPLEILEKEFEYTYELFGVFYCIKYLTVATMYSYVLKHRFPAGFKIADAFEADRFRQYMVEFFGEKGASITNRSLDAKISNIGVLCDRGKYIHPDFIRVDKSIIDAINDYVDNSPRSLIPYSEIYEAMKNTFEGTQITNRYLLQGALKKYGCRFYTGRDFIRKTQSVTLVDELESFVEERGIVHKAEILAEFTSISEAGLGQVVARSSNIFNIGDGYYMHASQFDIRPEDYEPLREYLKTACRDIPVNIRSVHDAVSLRFPEFMYRNDFADWNKLFAALNYMFKGEFSFSRPYIGKLGVNDLSNRGVILRHIEEYDSIEIEELIDICEENNIHYITTSQLFQMLMPDYIRVNRSTLMKKEYTGITDDIVAKAVEFVLDMLEANDYIVASKIDDFLWLPQIDVDWNAFLLESVIMQSKKINIVNLVGDPFKHPNSVYVSDQFQNDTFDSLLLKVLTDEVRKGTFTSKAEMRDWLKEEGFIDDKLPKFLESAKYFYVNDTGVHCTGE